MKYTEVRNKPTTFLALTSVNITLFDEILPFFTEAHNEYFRWHDVKGKKLTRRRSHVIQSNSPLPTVADRLFFILVYLKNNPTKEYLGECFGMAQQQCGQWIHTLTEVLQMALDDAEMLPATTMGKFKKMLEERGGADVVHELIHDGTEREIPRPSNPDLQKEYYSGKKKKHTVKNAVITCLAGFILFCGPTV
ncbi:MAG: transposase, partial [Prevotella sp.]|nr:transposase [Prevotella sp.]